MSNLRAIAERASSYRMEIVGLAELARDVLTLRALDKEALNSDASKDMQHHYAEMFARAVGAYTNARSTITPEQMIAICDAALAALDAEVGTP